MTTANDLILYSKKVLGNRQLIAALQREPYVHIHTPRGIRLDNMAGGAHVLLDGILRQTGGSMVAIAAGDADREVVDSQGRIAVPPKEKNYFLRRIFLTKKELDGFYSGFANQTLWPLCHAVFVKPIFSPVWWDEYVKVNQKFADAIIAEDEVDGREGVVWINDYHLALVPSMLKAKKPSIKIGTFWHIPWPTYEIFRICPWRKQLLEGLLGSDFIGFHRGYHVENFVECARRELEVIVDSEPRSIVHKDRETKLAFLPAGIDYHEIKEKLEKYKLQTPTMLKEEFGVDSPYVIVGVDRIDYTKGLKERIKILDRFFTKYPKFREKVIYLQIGSPSRVHIPAYKALNRELTSLVNRVNAKYQTKGWKPLHFMNKIVPREKIFAYYRLSDVCLVTPLDDGMNLVAKEYVICADNGNGSLVLSKFAGAAKDLKSAILINPYDIERSADDLYNALTMPKEEKQRRMADMKNVVKENNIYNWGIEFIKHTLS